MGYGAILGQQPNSTTYTKTQILNPSDATLIGLNNNALPADMFHILSTVGDLHVWRRTIQGKVDYPVSTNRNAYQEGNNAKPAGYTLGNKTKKQILYLLQHYSQNEITVSVSSSVTVSSDGEVSLSNPSTTNVSAIPDSFETLKSLMAGKFCTISQGTSGYWIGGIVQGIFYFPASASFAEEQSGSIYNWYIDQYQTVTGYPAIPAGTTIEYLGNLGNKPEVVYGSYTGDGNTSKTINLGKYPKVVFAAQDGSYFTDGYDDHAAFAARGIAARDHLDKSYTLSVTSTGFTVYNATASGAKLNAGRKRYIYFALL